MLSDLHVYQKSESRFIINLQSHLNRISAKRFHLPNIHFQNFAKFITRTNANQEKCNKIVTFYFDLERVYILGFMRGAGRGNRTPTLSPTRDFESRASTNSAIPAFSDYTLLYNCNGAIIASSLLFAKLIFTN
jgi:hypothetical protein